MFRELSERRLAQALQGTPATNEIIDKAFILQEVAVGPRRIPSSW